MAAGWYKAWPRGQMPCAWDSEECLAGRDPGETKPPFFFPGNGNHTTYKHGDDKRGWFNFVLPASVFFNLFRCMQICKIDNMIVKKNMLKIVDFT